MEQHPEFELKKSAAVFPICELVQWVGHGITPPTDDEAHVYNHVKKLPKDENHPHVREARAKGHHPDHCGHCVNQAGLSRLVEPGEHLAMYPAGLIHHKLKDVSRHYETDPTKFVR